jgi:hypothetical protein
MANADVFSVALIQFERFCFQVGLMQLCRKLFLGEPFSQSRDYYGSFGFADSVDFS